MAIIPQKRLFRWNEVEQLDDLHRLRLVLERSRGLGRNDYPIRAVWNWLLAGIVFQHNGIESLRRALQRNAPLVIR